MTRVRLDVDVNADPRALRALGTELDRTARKADDLGDEADGAKRDLSELGRQMEKLTAQSRILAAALSARPGDNGLLKQFRDTRRELNQLKTVAKTLDVTPPRQPRVPRPRAQERGFIQGLVSRIPGVGGGLAALPTPAIGGLAAGTAVLGGGLASTAVLAGVGLGGIASGAALAAQNEEVQRVYGELGRGVFTQLRQDAEATFVRPMVDSADVFAAAWVRQEPRLQSMFKDLAAEVKPLSEGIARGFEEVMPGLQRAVKGSRPVLRELGHDLPMIGHALGDFLGMIGHAGPGAAATLKYVMQAMSVLIETTGGGIMALGEFAEMLDRLNQATGIFEAPVLALGDALQRDSDKAREGNDSVGGLVEQLRNLGREASDSAAELKRLEDVQQGLIDAKFDLATATLQYNENLIELRKTVADNGTDLRSYTEAGIANRQELISDLEVIRQMREAFRENGDTAANADAKVQGLIKQFVNMAVAAGFNRDQVMALITSLGLLPREVHTNIKVTTSGVRVGSLATGHVAFREGGIAWARDGLVNLSRRAGIAHPGSQPLIGFAEPGNPEAVISASAPRQRSLDILDTAASWHGASVVPNGGGEVLGYLVVRHEYPDAARNREELLALKRRTGLTSLGLA